MPLVNSSIPNLAQGVSQQPDNLRFAGQHEAQENMLSSVVDGLRKRPFTEFVGELGTDAAIDPDSFVYLINRDSSNRHLLVIEPNSSVPKIYDTADGSAISVYDAPTNTNPPSIAYINEANPRENLRALTVADTTFILNKTQTISALGTSSDATVKKAVVFIKQGAYERKYAIDIIINGVKTNCEFLSGNGTGAGQSEINGTTVSTSTAAGYATGDVTDAQTDSIAQGLWAAIIDQGISDIVLTLASFNSTVTTESVVAPDYSDATNGDAILIEYTGNDSFSVEASDSVSEQGVGVIQDEVNSVTDLPVHCFEENNTKINGDLETAQDDYYVKFENLSGDSFDGAIKDITLLTKGSTYSDAAAGPHNLIFTGGGGSGAAGTFTLDNYGGNWRVETITLTNGGSGYTSTPTLDFSDAGTSVEAATAHVTLYNHNKGKWTETVAPSTPTALTATDMPYKLEPQPGLSTYYIEANTWGTRLVGDTETNPDPSFVGNTIENIFFWKNRLGFLSGQNILFSEADEYYNFFRTTVLQLLDSAPIDVGISHTKVSNLKHVATFQEKLIVFSDETQFVIKGNELLTPKTINVTPTTEYTALAGVEPLTQGNFIYFPFPRNSYNGVNEYAIDLNTDTFRGEEITGQVPKYIPADIKQLVGSPTEDIIVATTSNSSGTTDLYVYKYFWRGNERVQSAWSRFTFQDDIVHAFFIESDLYLVTEDGTNTHLEKMSLESGLVDTGESYAIHLDKRRAVSGLSPSYDPGTDKTTIVAGYPIGPVFDFSNGGAGTGATANVTYNSSGTITAVTVNAGGSGYTNGTGYALILTGGNPTTAATITFDVSGGAVSNFTITDGGLGYSIAEVWSQGGTKATRDVSSFGNTIVVNGDYSGSPTEAYVGIPYTSSVTLTRPTVKQSADGNGRSVSGYSHQIVRNGSIEYANTGHFKVSVATKFRSSYEHIFNANILGADTLLGQLVLQDGTFQFPVYANVNDITVTITSESALPMQLLATEFESTVASRSRRIAT